MVSRDYVAEMRAVIDAETAVVVMAAPSNWRWSH